MGDIMIRDARECDKEQIRSLWLTSFSLKSGDYINCFFENGYDYGRTVINEIDNKIVSTVHIQDFNLMLNGTLIKANYLSHIATHPDYRRCGYMKECMESALNECEQKSLLTFVHADNPKILEEFGFMQASLHRYFDIKADELERVETVGVSKEFTANDLKMAYDLFVKHFDGYKVRNLYHFAQMIEECKLCNESILIYRNENNEIEGYVRYADRNGQIKVKECIYSGSVALLKLLKAAVSHHTQLQLEVSEAEHLEKIFPMAISRKRVYTMVRCNNLNLFNKLFNTKVKNSMEAYQIASKPIYLNERK